MKQDTSGHHGTPPVVFACCKEIREGALRGAVPVGLRLLNRSDLQLPRGRLPAGAVARQDFLAAEIDIIELERGQRAIWRCDSDASRLGDKQSMVSRP
jgi:hypothetical protein